MNVDIFITVFSSLMRALEEWRQTRINGFVMNPDRPFQINQIPTSI
jgi:hypothetical protein